jgi:hypothetical protein
MPPSRRIAEAGFKNSTVKNWPVFEGFGLSPSAESYLVALIVWSQQVK